jgi:hypothetical protein
MERVPFIAEKFEKKFCEYEDNLVVIDRENKKEHEYLIPKSKIDRFDRNQIYLLHISLKEYEV